MLSAARGLAAAKATRRTFLSVTGAAAALALTGNLPGVGATGRPKPIGNRPLFTLGVASGDPLPDAVVIWTRLAPGPLEPFGGMDDYAVGVDWEVAEDEQFRRIVRRGKAQARPEYAHTVHVDVRGLRPWRHYFYRFRVGAQISPVGRTRTAPAATDQPEVTMAVASCQAFYDGYYTAYQDVARRDHDVVLFLGDYIYEVGVGPTAGVRNQEVPVDFAGEIFTLDEYRARYALHKTDPDLQAAHAASAWVVTLDDHEVEGNWAGYISEDGLSEAEFLVRRANGFRAYWEHMPLRLDQSADGPSIRLHRHLRYGRTADLSVLDTRQFRSDQPGDGSWLPPDEVSLDPARTLTGAAQERWLLDNLRRSTGRWNVVAQQVAMAQLDRKTGAGLEVPMDTWNGYAASRQRVLSGVRDRGVRNLVVLTGDLHRSVASDLKPDFDDPSSPVVGSEFVTTSISSGKDGVDVDTTGRALLAENPHVKYQNVQRGYLSCTLDRERWTSEFRIVDRVTTPGGTPSTRATLVVENGVPGVNQA
ncbi:alkaline phosphatase [Kribbella sp. VKM Ac-2568]|uniref:alkaline phosphatase D family protein n=1 Tax=Kribbella sp. VKM Ac-2568 TaxID=2512219 RepID=UPI001048B96B|nr:alkaline phosphatase D family protein [Kribbella sp. VKM Ac-2568]TCM39541.1 alkaline phosphatase D [Kribbella sp. VKM Ac-2568]